MTWQRSLPAFNLLVMMSWFISEALFAQTALKKITYEQAYLNKEPLLFKPLTTAFWLDDENYLLRERDEKTKATRLLRVRRQEAGERQPPRRRFLVQEPARPLR